MDDLEQILSCSICMEIYQSPRQLPCQHTYCTACLADFINKNKKGSTRIGFHIYCPLCRDKVTLDKTTPEATNFPLNLTIQSFLNSKELMLTLQQSQAHAAKSTTEVQNVYTKIRKYFSVKSKATQTEELTGNKTKSTGMQTDMLPVLERQKSTNANKVAKFPGDPANHTQAEFLTFYNISIFNVYKPLFTALFEPLITRCSVTRKYATIALAGLICVFYFLIVAAVLITSERISFFILLFSEAILLQVLYVRIKFDFTQYRLKQYTYAFMGYIVFHIFTMCAIGLVYLVYIYHLSAFTVSREYAFKHVNMTVWTPEGFQIQQQTIYEGDSEIKKEEFNNLEHSIRSDYVQYLNFHMYQLFAANMTNLKLYGPLLFVILFCLVLPLTLVQNPQAICQQMQHFQRRRSRPIRH